MLRFGYAYRNWHRRFVTGAPKPDHSLSAWTSGPGRSAKARSPPRAEVAGRLTNVSFGVAMTAAQASGLSRRRNVRFWMEDSRLNCDPHGDRSPNAILWHHTSVQSILQPD